MRNFLYINFIWIIFVLIQVVYASDNPLGILVEVRSKKVLESKKLKEIIGKNNLEKNRYYSILKVQSYKLKDKNQKDLKSFCKKIVKEFPEILSCELNLKIYPQDSKNCSDSKVDCPDKTNSSEKGFIPSYAQQIKSDCDLFNITKIKERYNYESKKKGLSPLWAQEYIGSDLLKEEMHKRKVDVSKASNLLGIWDSDSFRHGEQVANLIMGPHESALISSDGQKAHLNLQETESYIASYEKNFRECREKDRCPRFINNSMDWKNSNQLKKVVSRLSKEGSVFVTSAGNDNELVEDIKRKSSQEKDSIIVASYAPSGLSSSFTNYAPEVDISAPSDDYILSFNKDGSAKTFGGTSGATPLVTSTLLAFELIAGGKLSTAQFKDLLNKTAITHSKDPIRKFTGKGYLNTYKIGAVAFRLKELCKSKTSIDEKNKCIQDKLNEPSTYDFSKKLRKDKVIKNFESAFPECATKRTSKTQTYTCEQKEIALKKLRKASFLNPNNLKYWKKLACIYKENRLDVNAQYYSRLAKGKRLASVPSDLSELGNADLVELLQYDLRKSKNRKVALKIIKRNPFLLQNAHEDIRKDRKIVLAAVKEYGFALENGHAINQEENVLKFIHESLRKDKKIFLEAVKQDVDALKYAHEDLRKDRKIALTAIKYSETAFIYVHDDLKKNRAFVLAAVKRNGSLLKYVNENFRKDKKIVLAAVKQKGTVLKYAHDELKNDEKIVLAAVKQDGDALEFAHEGLIKDKTIVLEAVKQDGGALEFAHEDLRKDKKIVLEAVKQDGGALEFAHEDIRKDKKIVLAAVKQNAVVLLDFHHEFNKDKEIFLTAVKQKGFLLKFAHKNLRKDIEIALAAVKQDERVLEYVHEDLRYNRAFILEAVKQNAALLFYVHPDFKKDREIVLAAVKQKGFLLKFAHKDLRKDKEIVLEAVKQDGDAIEFAYKDLRDDRDILEAVK